MRRTRIMQFGIVTATGLVLALALGPGITTARARTDPSAPAESCTFAILATNNYSFDVFVDLYDSYVRNHAVVAALFSVKQLKIQNQRIPHGGSMNRRYTASGKCPSKRTWTIYVRKGSSGAQQTVSRVTSGTTSASRTVNLGKASKW